MSHDKCGNDQGCVAPTNEHECGWARPVLPVGTKVTYSKHFLIDRCIAPGGPEWRREGVITSYSASGFSWVRWATGDRWDRSVNPVNLTTPDDPELVEFIAHEEKIAHQQSVLLKIQDVQSHLNLLGCLDLLNEAADLYKKAEIQFST